MKAFPASQQKYTVCQWPTNNDHYQMIIKWSQSCTLNQFSHFLIVGFLCFLGIQSSTWCSHNTKTSCRLKALDWNSFNVSFYAPVSGHPGWGGGGDPGEPAVICTTTFTNPPYPKTRSFNKKLLTPLPRGGGEEEMCSAKSKGAIFQKSPICHN